ncbi:hypothetical protein F2Q69_00012786 [Brassica cretica]|uniref:Uncharacterized protein n=1 Tax=Brassica cretica TaxID=69181 RepID=A0A8S9QWI6_BRACR|nr:hypothetical protein F2Q69_00012786 [Brassica cretica]
MVKIADEILHIGYTGELPCQQSRGQSCPNNFAVDSRVAFSQMEVAEGVLIITPIMGPCVARRCLCRLKFLRQDFSLLFDGDVIRGLTERLGSTAACRRLIAGIQVDLFTLVILCFPLGWWKVFQDFPLSGYIACSLVCRAESRNQVFFREALWVPGEE